MHRLAKDRAEAFKIRGSTKGLSVMAPTLYNASESKIMPYRDANGIVNTKVLPPCVNCKYLIGGSGNGFTLARFEEGLTTK